MLKLILVWFIFMRTTNHLKIINEVVVEKIGSEEGTLGTRTRMDLQTYQVRFDILLLNTTNKDFIKKST